MKSDYCAKKNLAHPGYVKLTGNLKTFLCMNDVLLFRCNCKSYPVTAAIFPSCVRENSITLDAYKLREFGLPYIELY